MRMNNGKHRNADDINGLLLLLLNLYYYQCAENSECRSLWIKHVHTFSSKHPYLCVSLLKKFLTAFQSYKIRIFFYIDYTLIKNQIPLYHLTDSLSHGFMHKWFIRMNDQQIIIMIVKWFDDDEMNSRFLWRMMWLWAKERDIYLIERPILSCDIQYSVTMIDNLPYNPPNQIAYMIKIQILDCQKHQSE